MIMMQSQIYEIVKANKEAFFISLILKLGDEG